MDLLFKTRGKSSPTGKSRVYFYCHPEDFNTYFNDIINDILEISNCSIWYKSNPSIYIEEDFELTLGQMQLVVIPITRKFLTDDIAMKSKEFNFFNDRHIPILPLLQDTQILNLYNEKFKNVQALSKFETDISALSFSKKLENFLNSVLLDDEITNKIKSEFDAHFFISYRKKDRKFANEFMQLIHDYDEFEDIGIWYDEFLTPGEKFDYEIKQSINNCDVFSIVITPNIVNELNYVVTTEYPLAKECKKIIFPAELVKTEKELIRKTLEDITQPIDVHNKDILNESLKNILFTLNIKENDFNPKHKYLIGLAYLSGIDVEVNIEKGIKILTKCAKLNYLPAIEKLVDVYHRGHGVTIDYNQAIRLQTKIVNIKKELVSKGDITSTLDYIAAVSRLSSLFIEIFETESATQLLQDAINLLNTIKKEELNSTSFYYYNLCFNKLALCCRMKDDAITAGKYYKQAIDLMEHFWESKKEIVEKYLLELYNNVGTQFLELGDYECAKQYFELAFAMSEHMFNENTSDKEHFAYVLVTVYNNLGAIADFQGQMSLEYYGKAIALIQQYLIDKRKIIYFRAASTVYLRAGIRLAKLKDFPTANSTILEALKFIKQVLKQSLSIEDLMDEANCYSHLASLNVKLEKDDDAISYYHNAIDSLKKVLKINDNPKCRKNLCMAYRDIALILLSKKELVNVSGTNMYKMTDEELYEIREYCIRAIDIMTPLLEKYMKLMTTYNQNGPISIKKEMVADIESVADIWLTLSCIDVIPFPIEKGILMYSWLLRICPENKEYKEILDGLEKRLKDLSN